MFVLLYELAHTSVHQQNPRHSFDIAFEFAGTGAFASPEHDDFGLAGVLVDNHAIGFVVDNGVFSERERFKLFRVQVLTLVVSGRCT